MILNDLRTRNALAGGLGGFIAWLLIEPLVAPQLQRVVSLGELVRVDALFGALAGVCIGAALGIAEGFIVRSPYLAQRGGLIGAGAGLVGGVIGLLLGEMVYQPLKLLCFVGRSLGWAVFGAILGCAEGITRRSWRGLRSAALGGLIGGGIGGFMFDLVAIFTVLLFRSDALSRGVALVILGACIGLWIVILERAMAQGLLKVVSGRMEGREFVLDKPTLSLGSDERGDIALFGDPASLPRHATLRQQGRGFAIEALPGAMLTVNGQPVGQATLASGDRLTVGSTRLIYRDKATAPAQVPALVPPEPAPASPSWSPPPVWAPPAAPQPLGSPVAAGMLSLLDPTTGQRFALRQGLTTIGRAPDNDIVLTHPSVSAHHAEVRYEAGRHIVHDKGSTNGTFVNGRRVLGPNMIKAGWTVQFGEQELRAM